MSILDVCVLLKMSNDKEGNSEILSKTANVGEARKHTYSNF